MIRFLCFIELSLDGTAMVKIEKTFAEHIFRMLKEDEELGKYVENLILPSDKAKTKAKASSVVGGILGATIGIGWTSQAGVGIIFKNCPISYASILDSGVVRLHLRVRYPKGIDRRLVIGKKTKGLFHKEVTGTRFHSTKDLDPVRKKIENDQNLLNHLFQLFKSGYFDDAIYSWKVKIDIEDGGSRARIEAKLFGDIPQNLVREFFTCLLRIASYVGGIRIVGTYKLIKWAGQSNRKMRTTIFEIPDNSNAEWFKDRHWIIRWAPKDANHWEQKWYDATHCKIDIHDATTDKLLKRITLKCQNPDDVLEVRDLRYREWRFSEPLTIWGKIYLVIEVEGRECQWEVEVKFFEGQGETGFPSEKEEHVYATEQGSFETEGKSA